jgi:transposase
MSEGAMFRPREKQSTFFDATYICEKLIPEDCFYRKFREIVWPIIRDDEFAPMYCKDNGRPSIAPALLAVATILQFHRNLSDREMERACMYDIEIKYALGLRLDERPFDHSSLGDFRERLLKNGKEKEIFDRILEHLIKAGLIHKNEIQRIDATHVIADIAIPTTVTLVRRGTYGILKVLKKRHKALYERVGQKIDLSRYSKDEVVRDFPNRADEEIRAKKLVEVVRDARSVLDEVKEVKDEVLIKQVRLLKRILGEQTIEDQDGNPKERKYKERPKDLLVSPVDPDARFGAKSDKKRFTGYKANITETIEGRFITGIRPMPGNRPDGETAVSLVQDQKGLGITPPKLIGDSAYGYGSYRRDLKARGTEVVAPLREKNDRSKTIYPKSVFHYDEETNTLACPEGVITRQAFYDKPHDLRVFHFPMTVCQKCPRKPECTNSKDGRRTVGISSFNQELRDAEEYNLTEQFKEEMKLRAPIEGKLSELTRYHGMRRARYRGLNKVGLQCYFTAAAVNIKRWVKLMFEGFKPKIACPAVS